MEQTLFLLLVVAFGLSLSFNLEPPENKWVVLSDKFELQCRSSLPLKSCSWTTPYGKNFPLSKGLTAESGRFEYSGNDDQDCGIAIASFEDKDAGKWTCLVSVVNGSEVTTAEGHAQVSKAQMPTSVHLTGSFEDGVANVSLYEKINVDCVVDNARPKPLITWYVDEMELTGTNTTDREDMESFTQTLIYNPEETHINKSLKCVVDHVSLKQPIEAILELSFNENVSIGETRSVDTQEDLENKKDSYYIIAIVGAVVILLSFFILFASSKKLLCFSYLKQQTSASNVEKDAELKSLHAVDAEQVKEESPMNPSEESTAVVNEAAYQKLGERFASFFRLRKSGMVTENKDVEVGTEKVIEEKNIEVEKKEEMDETTEEEQSGETAPLANEIRGRTFGDRVSSFFRLRKTQSLTEDVEAGKEKVGEEVDSAKPATDEKEEVVGDETEGEKGEKDVEEKEKSIVKTKTDIMSCFAAICNLKTTDEQAEEKKVEETEKATINESEKQIEFEPEDKEKNKTEEKKETNETIESTAPIHTPV